MAEGLRIDRPYEGVVVLTLDRPAQLNALTDSMLLEVLPDTFADLERDESARVVVLTGAGRAFCSGADLGGTGFLQPTVEASQQFLRRSHRTVQNMRSLSKPIIAAVSGPAIGAGLGLVAASDIRIAGPDASFAVPLVRFGLTPDYGTSYLLPRIVGVEQSMHMLLTGETVVAADALRIGLVGRIVPNALTASVDLAKKLAGLPTGAVAETKKQLYAGSEASLAETIDNEIRAASAALQGPEFRVAFQSWREEIQGDTPV